LTDELDLTELSLEELYEQMGDDLYDGYQEEVVEGVQEALGRGITPYDVLTDGLVAGMDIVARLPRWHPVCTGGIDGG
jgi:methanogenic corrinoid protein MtbC1